MLRTFDIEHLQPSPPLLGPSFITPQMILLLLKYLRASICFRYEQELLTNAANTQGAFERHRHTT